MATSPSVNSAEPTVCISSTLEPPRYESPRPLARSREELWPFPLSRAPSFCQQDDAVCDALDLGEVVAHEDHREPEAGVQIANELLYLAPGALVEGARGLVEHKGLGLQGEGPRHRDALLLPDGERLRDAPAPRRVEPHHFEQPSGIRAPAGQARPIQDRLLHGNPEECGYLEDHPDPTPQLQRVERARRLAVEVDLSRGRLYEAVDRAQQGALPRPGRPHDGRDFPGRHEHVDASQNLGAARLVAEPADLYLWPVQARGSPVAGRRRGHRRWRRCVRSRRGRRVVRAACRARWRPSPRTRASRTSRPSGRRRGLSPRSRAARGRRARTPSGTFRRSNPPSVGEPGPDHVEKLRSLRGLRGIAEESEGRLLVQEALDQPYAGGAVHVTSTSRGPQHQTLSSVPRTPGALSRSLMASRAAVSAHAASRRNGDRK